MLGGDEGHVKTKKQAFGLEKAGLSERPKAAFLSRIVFFTDGGDVESLLSYILVSSSD